MAQRLAQPANHRRHRVFLTLPLVKWFKTRKREAQIWRVAAEAESHHAECAVNFRRLAQRRFHLSKNVRGVTERCTLRRLHGNDEIAGVLVRNKSARNFLIEEIGESQPAQKDDERGKSPSHDVMERCSITLRHSSYAAVERCPNRARLSAHVAQQQRGKRRSQRQGVERRNRNGERNRQRKLAE